MVQLQEYSPPNEALDRNTEARSKEIKILMDLNSWPFHDASIGEDAFRVSRDLARFDEAPLIADRDRIKSYPSSSYDCNLLLREFYYIMWKAMCANGEDAYPTLLTSRDVRRLANIGYALGLIERGSDPAMA